ncbi:uncharacterized protein LOC141816347 [Curcuma longa]|uniref:uncharacterized protein LOC141816347 n=1 Tax=Curcuma longa TaxID=136217 RepID=UPI003D9E05DA
MSMSLSSHASPVLPFLPFRSLPHKPQLRCAAVSGNPLRKASSRKSGGALLGANHSDSENKAHAGQNGGLEVLYDDGFGDVSVKDYFDAARAINKPDGGAPRWFCPVECGAPIKGSPLLLFLPGADGVGMGLILHHKSLGKVFEVRCLHIPVNDRTPFEGLLKIVDNAVKNEFARSPHTPIYLVGESFGGCLALAVAACNPDIDLVLVLVNPATSFGKSQLQPIIPLLEALPRNLHATVPYFLSFIMGMLFISFWGKARKKGGKRLRWHNIDWCLDLHRDLAGTNLAPSVGKSELDSTMADTRRTTDNPEPTEENPDELITISRAGLQELVWEMVEAHARRAQPPPSMAPTANAPPVVPRPWPTEEIPLPRGSILQEEVPFPRVSIPREEVPLPRGSVHREERPIEADSWGLELGKHGVMNAKERLQLMDL